MGGGDNEPLSCSVYSFILLVHSLIHSDQVKANEKVSNQLRASVAVRGKGKTQQPTHRAHLLCHLGPHVPATASVQSPLVRGAVILTKCPCVFSCSLLIFFHSFKDFVLK